MYKTFNEFLANKDIVKNARQKFKDMKQRCYNPKNKDYNWYGGKGITICDEWLKDINKFLSWLWKNDYKKSADKESIDRIDSSKGYSPDNCRLVSIAFNGRYIKGVEYKPLRYSNVNLYYKAHKQIKYETIKARNKAGWEKEDIINKPVLYKTTSIKTLQQALNFNWNRQTFIQTLIKFRNDTNKLDIKSYRNSLFKQALEIIKEYKLSNNAKKKSKDLLRKRKVLNGRREDC